MNMFAAIALSPSNKAIAKVTDENKHTVVAQQRYNHNFHWFHIWILEHPMGEIEFDTTDSKLDKEAKSWGFDPDAKHWEPIL